MNMLRKKLGLPLVNIVLLYSISLIPLSGFGFGGYSFPLRKMVEAPTLLINFSLQNNPYKYSNYYQDIESNVYYLKARYYAPELMRFISRDTYDLSNHHAYCSGNPISNIDPSGHNGLSFLFTVVAAVLTVAVLGTALWEASLPIAGTDANLFTISFGSVCSYLTMGIATVFSAGSVYFEAIKNRENSTWFDYSWRREETARNIIDLVSIAFGIACLSTKMVDLVKMGANVYNDEGSLLHIPLKGVLTCSSLYNGGSRWVDPPL